MTSRPEPFQTSQPQPLPKRVIAGLAELLLERVEAAEGGVDRGCAGRRSECRHPAS